MRNPFNAIRRCEELTYENAELRKANDRLTFKANAKIEECEDLAAKVDHLRKIVKDLTEKNDNIRKAADAGCDPAKEELIEKQEDSIVKLLAQLEASEQGRERAVKKLCAANKENKMLLHINSKLCDFLDRPHYQTTLNKEEAKQ